MFYLYKLNKKLNLWKYLKTTKENNAKNSSQEKVD